MGIHFTTAVVPAARSGADTDNAVLIFAADTQDDIANLPLPVALHVQDNELCCFAPHGQMLGAPLRVSDDWVAAASPTGLFEAQARVCVVLEPLPEEAGTSHVPQGEGVTEWGLPSWVGGRRRGPVQDGASLGACLDRGPAPARRRPRRADAAS
uniref:hypothetical protein n=1 Tax=Streptomyces sp. F12 TaxID=1436084 RepID=UPI0015E859A5|nr:hypothetical protein [Streptomyces sp. F12]